MIGLIVISKNPVSAQAPEKKLAHPFSRLFLPGAEQLQNPSVTSNMDVRFGQRSHPNRKKISSLLFKKFSEETMMIAPSSL